MRSIVILLTTQANLLYSFKGWWRHRYYFTLLRVVYKLETFNDTLAVFYTHKRAANLAV